ncbi:MAG: ligase-associated DNA damage response endonuclease PdeM [Planctomycetota bacterium]|jgi:DNA ligase-associated metallophosphoesterase|nr:ligase-associated DNA damage response endonuclease PdeM [Planctomycetota bacterium]
MLQLYPLAPSAIEKTGHSSLAVSIEGLDFRLLAKRGLYWPEQKILFIADTHFGKEATFRSQGIAVPRGSTEGTVATIAQMISECQASRLVLLGDMFHARSSISEGIRESLDAFFLAHPQLRFTLVLGNHDRGIQALTKGWPIEIIDSGAAIGSVSVSHLPQEPSLSTKLLLCGHLHPAYRFTSKMDSVGKLPCFWLSNRQFVLPAIGEFTGTQVIHPSKSDQTWVIVDDQILRI